MKKIFTILCVTLFSLATMANGVQIGDLYYLLDDTTYTASVTYTGGRYGTGYENNYRGYIDIPDTIVCGENKYVVTSIGEGAFYMCSIVAITLPNSLKSIEKLAFSTCYFGDPFGEPINIPNSVTTIGDDAFFECSGLTSPIFNANCFAYMPSSFSGDYIISDGIKQIAGGAFSGCSGLTSVTIPNSITTIGTDAFYECIGLTSPVFNANCFAYMPPSFSGDYIVSDGIKQIAGGAFKNCKYLDSVIIPNSVTKIDEYAFEFCSSLNSVEIPNSVTTIGMGAFDGCTNLTSLIISPTVTSIEMGAFMNCSGLQNVYISNLEAWCKIKFEDFNSNPLTYATSLYLNDEKITNLVIPSSIVEIQQYAFQGYNSLTSVTIPNSITTIRDGAFENCSGLTSITCLAIEPPFLEGYVFDEVPRNIPLYVPHLSVSVYQATGQWNEFEINPLAVDVDPIASDTSQLSWLPVDSASLYKLRIYSEQIELDTTLLIEADSLNGGISIPVSLAPQRVRRMPMDDIGSVVVITLEPNSGATKDTPFKVTVSTTSKDKIDIGFDLTVLKEEKTIKQESGSFTLNNIPAIVTSFDKIAPLKWGSISGIYDLYGRHYYINQWNQLPAGIYILREGEKASKVMKR